jgi:hypothetical protein
MAKSLKSAIADYLKQQAAVYRTAPDRAKRDFNSARETSRDHAKRWIFEVIQNSDDAEATRVTVHVEPDAIYVADNGKGLKADAIRSISGTHFSIKPAGCIGRKGLGFKAVYEVSDTPYVVTGNEGVFFCPDEANKWWREYVPNLSLDNVPYQWLPFFITRANAENRFSALAALRSEQTVVSLPFIAGKDTDTIIAPLRELRPEALLTFRFLTNLRVSNSDEPFLLRIEPTSKNGTVYLAYDSRTQHPTRWRVHRKRGLHPSPDILQELDSDEIDRAMDSSLFVAAIEVDDITRPVVAEPNLLHVYYPTHEESPVPLLLHADFVVKSDRTRLIPFENSKFNAWMADQLAFAVVEFVNKFYAPACPAANVQLLVPTHNARHGTGAPASLWARIVSRAKTKLRLPNLEGERRLTPDNARLIDAAGHGDDVRAILHGCRESIHLVHPTLNDSSAIRSLLKELECKVIENTDVLRAIGRQAAGGDCTPDWTWACWRWLASWYSKPLSYGETCEERLAAIRDLPILPVDGHLLAINRIEERMSWRDRSTIDDIPDWLPLRFVDDWFRDRLLSLDDNDLIHKLLAQLDIRTPGDNVVLESLGKAIESYWEDPAGNPGRFIEFLTTRIDGLPAELPVGVDRCPIRVRIGDIPGRRWSEARVGYFGRNWGEMRIACLYQGESDIPWVCRPRNKRAADKYRTFLEWLGVKAFPRIIHHADRVATSAEYRRVESKLPHRTECGPIAPPLMIDRITVSALDPTHSKTLLCLLAEHWSSYYRDHASIEVDWYFRRWQRERIDACWWSQVKKSCVPPQSTAPGHQQPLESCLLADASIVRRVGKLVPCVELARFGDDRSTVERWLRYEAHLRTSLDELSIDEWIDLLDKHLLAYVNGAEDRRSACRVAWRLYETALGAQNANANFDRLSRLPILCKKGDDYRFVPTDEQRWLADDGDLSGIFEGDCWQVHLQERSLVRATRCFGLHSLAEGSRRLLEYESDACLPHPNLQERLDLAKPFVFAWLRRKLVADDDERLRQFVQEWSVQCVPQLIEVCQLPDVPVEKRVNRCVGHDGGWLLLRADKADETHLAQALDLAIQSFCKRHSDSDFYENLLRCRSPDEHVTKLRSKGCAAAAIEDAVCEYNSDDSAHDSDNAHDRYPRSADLNDPKPSFPDLSAAAADPVDREQKREPSVPPRGQAVSSNESQVPTSPSSPFSRRVDAGSMANSCVLELKDPDLTAIEYRTPTGIPRHRIDAFRVSEGKPEAVDAVAGEPPSNQLTDSQRRQIEEASRRIARRKLEGFGYIVEPMPYMNPGFDLKATMRATGEVLLIEVKGHQDAASVVEVTARQLSTHLSLLSSSGATKWQLWNVEYLAADARQVVTISAYDLLHPDSLVGGEVRVDLTRCGFDGRRIGPEPGG